MKKLTLIFSGLLLTGELFEWWLMYFSGFHIPVHIPSTPINLAGLLLVALMLTILIIFIKKITRLKGNLSVSRLTFAGTVICFIAECSFQLIRLFFENGDTLKTRLVAFCTGISGITIFGAVLSFFVSYQLKTRKTGMLLLFIISFLAFLAFLRTKLPLQSA